MSTAERFNRAALAQPGAMEGLTRDRFGMDARTLEGHLQVMSQIASGRVTSQGREWLYAQAQKSGVPRQHVDAELKAVLALPSPRERQARYVAAAGANPSLVSQALELASRYDTSRAAIAIEDRLSDADRSRQQWRSSSFRFEDRPEFQSDRKDAADGIRGSIERAMVSSGLIAPKPRTLQETQARAVAYANAAADRLERRLHNKEEASLRDAVEEAYLATDAMAAKADAGLGDDTPGAVMERADADQTFAESMTEAP